VGIDYSINEGEEAMKINQRLVDAVGAASDELTARGLMESDELVLLALAASADETGQVFRGEYDVAVRLTGFSWAAVELSFQRLKSAGMVEGSSVWTIPFRPHPNDPGQLVLQPRPAPAQYPDVEEMRHRFPYSEYSNQDDEEGDAS
jgi:hypothetical protein